MLKINMTAAENHLLDDNDVQQQLALALAGQFKRQRVLVLIPDHTRTIPPTLAISHTR